LLEESHAMSDAALTVYLARHPLFQGLDSTHIARIAGHAEERAIPADQRVFTQDTEASHFFILKEGTVAVEIPALDGEPLTIQNLGAGATIGWSWLIPPYRWLFDARATSSCVVVAVDGKSLRAACDENPVLGYELMKRFAALMAERLNAARQAAVRHYQGT
jgi:CRP/FNR family transcriptional regulator, cyclic AMP receptor protein